MGDFAHSTRRASQLALQLANEGGQSGLAFALEPFGRQDRADIGKRPLDIGIDHHVVVFGPMAHFLGGLGHAPRSEDHTSELHSPYDNEYRLLLEKKKKK